MSKQDINLQLIENLKHLKLRDGLTNKELADYLDTTEAVIKNYFGGITPLPEEHISKLSDKLKVSIDWLLRGKVLFGDSQFGYKIHEPEIEYISAGRGSAGDIDLSMTAIVANAIGQLEPGEWKLFMVDGISMMPTVFPSDKLICKKIAISDMVNNRVYVVITDKPDMVAIKPDGKFIKRCALRKTGQLNCKSDNKDSSEAFMTFRLDPHEIKTVWEPALRITGSFPDPNRDIYDKLDELEERIEELEKHKK